MDITPAMLRDWDACWDDDAIAEAFGDAESLTALEILDREPIPSGTRVEILLRPEVLGDRFQPTLDAIVARAKRSARFNVEMAVSGKVAHIANAATLAIGSAAGIHWIPAVIDERERQLADIRRALEAA